jgi:hypothetical protein
MNDMEFLPQSQMLRTNADIETGRDEPEPHQRQRDYPSHESVRVVIEVTDFHVHSLTAAARGCELSTAERCDLLSIALAARTQMRLQRIEADGLRADMSIDALVRP